MKGETLLVRRGVAPIDSGARAALLPADSHADAALSKIPLGEVVAIKAVRQRSNQQNRLYWALIQHVAEATAWGNKDSLHKSLLTYLGYYDRVLLLNKKEALEIHSTAFDEMSQDEFQKYFDLAVQAICEHVIPGTNGGDLVREMEAILGS